ncbi:MAG: hypothetical protein M1376_04550 [Planctomycetes bacterium]|nr:hypothetical protein [Planctomycetota bacterium]
MPTIPRVYSSDANRWAQPTLRGPSAAPGPQISPAGEPGSEYFTIGVFDRQTGRGVPLVELRTTNSIRLFTDSNGIVAFREPGLMDREVFFFVASHGYEVPKDGFGYRGVRLKTTPGQIAVVMIDRLNIAERLYRVTGQGIYRDSILTGRPVAVQDPVLNGQVMGQDSVDTCIYRGRLFWIWGDTGKPSYPLGHFAMAGAVSDLPGRGGLDPAVGVNLKYFVDQDSFSRPLCRLKESGLVWLDGLLTVQDNEGRERMVAKFARLKDLGHALERGIVVFNDATQSFEPVVRTDPNGLPYPDFGHALRVTAEGREYWYFALPFPLTVRMRVEAKWDTVIDPNRYEVLTSLKPEDRRQNTEDGAARAALSSDFRWVRFGDLVGKSSTTRAQIIAALQREKKDTRFYDVESGKAITPHGGSVYFNAHRRKWIAIFVQAGGSSSYLGEVWYAEADTPVGPWAYARKVATHNKYSFYNPKQHPYFDQDGGRTIYFEGTYSWTFSGSEERATPRYDYNQIMYRLNLDDPRLALPAPVYQVRSERGGRDYLMGGAMAQMGKWESVESIAFYAIKPGRATDGLTTIYADRLSDGSTRLTADSPAAEAKPLFYALPSAAQTTRNECLVPLYEYRHANSGRRLYSTQSQLDEAGWSRQEGPLCQVYRTPPGPLLLDGQAILVSGYGRASRRAR